MNSATGNGPVARQLRPSGGAGGIFRNPRRTHPAGPCRCVRNSRCDPSGNARSVEASAVESPSPLNDQVLGARSLPRSVLAPRIGRTDRSNGARSERTDCIASSAKSSRDGFRCCFRCARENNRKHSTCRSSVAQFVGPIVRRLSMGRVTTGLSDLSSIAWPRLCDVSRLVSKWSMCR
jgi:hypothetical protein